MRPDISEFSYGYALTEELVSAHQSAITAAPIFPSLIAEGKEGAGWDMRLELLGIPAFLQFKVGHPVMRRTATEFTSNKFSVPVPPPKKNQPLCYRFYLRASKHSSQHASLVGLEAQHLVYYVAPAFHKPAQLDQAYLDKTVAQDSFWLRPSAVTLPDSREHHVSYLTPAGPYCFCSSYPTALEIDGSFEGFLRRAREHLANRRPVQLDDLLTDVSEQISALASERESSVNPREVRRPNDTGLQLGYMVPEVAKRNETLEIELTLNRAREELSLKARAAYLARTFLDAELLIIGPPIESVPA
jgi:hypothetical protein